MSSYGFGKSAKRINATKHLKTVFRRGLNTASGSFVAGSKVRFIHRPSGRR